MLLEHQKHKISAAIQGLDYDFDHFALGDFIAYIERRRGRPIRVKDFPMASMFGAWLTSSRRDYIMVSDITHPVHRAHIILHEIGHMVLEHPSLPLTDLFPPELLQALELEEALGCARFVDPDDRMDTPEEREAEEFVFQIRSRVSRANRLHELIEISTSIQSLQTLFNRTEA